MIRTKDSAWTDLAYTFPTAIPFADGDPTVAAGNQQFNTLEVRIPETYDGKQVQFGFHFADPVNNGDVRGWCVDQVTLGSIALP